MKKLTIIFLAVCVVLAVGCRWVGIRGNGHIVTDQRTIEDFSEIYSRGPFEIEWRAGSPAVSITTDENLLPQIETRKIDNYLELHTREQLRPTHHIKVLASSSQRIGAKHSGAGDLTVPALAGGKFAVQSSGAADVMLEGAVDELLADTSGASDLKARALQAEATCWLKAGRKSDALARLSQVAGDPTLRQAVSAISGAVAGRVQNAWIGNKKAPQTRHPARRRGIPETSSFQLFVNRFQERHGLISGQ